MRRHWAYLKYVLKHKWFVITEGFKLGVPIHLLIFHDMSKFRPFEWFSYARTFYTSSGGSQYKPDTNNFDLAWLYHIHKNKHHWQYWILNWDKSGDECLAMPARYALEMLADWKSAARVQGNDLLIWYSENKDNIKLHKHTRYWIEQKMGINLAYDST